jgi:hypothetical protein
MFKMINRPSVITKILELIAHYLSNIFKHTSLPFRFDFRLTIDDMHLSIRTMEKLHNCPEVLVELTRPVVTFFDYS